ncbi:9343_t:CDS:2 [Diversispora eburnea]|uniref:9343_t:CDS:1 n=1 Tax=Diversispora eburnea TaxID=1213867 RepID=A0A9N9B4M8_9GLOM|nr:9343_t:CDS:2 [Diversispora eburnea]
MFRVLERVITISDSRCSSKTSRKRKKNAEAGSLSSFVPRQQLKCPAKQVSIYERAINESNESESFLAPQRHSGHLVREDSGLTRATRPSCEGEVISDDVEVVLNGTQMAGTDETFTDTYSRNQPPTHQRQPCVSSKPDFVIEKRNSEFGEPQIAVEILACGTFISAKYWEELDKGLPKKKQSVEIK